ncbi:MAG: hypothetical protein PHQ21_03595 [Firmicutes bacterium]|jgi:hypothetical protein|nr:hypothetical protein [Bacillota bacterium]
MADTIAARLEQLKTEIEDLRAQLRKTAAQGGAIGDLDRACSVSDKLDVLILEFLRVKDQVDRTCNG